MSPPLLLSLLLMIEGVCVWGEWSVSYSPSHICALKGSTVTIKCTYSYPAGYQITEVFWTNTDISDFPDLSKDFTYSQRIEYLGDKDHNCSVKLTDVRLTDSQIYYFRFITDRPEGKWTGAPGVSLEITDLQVMSDAERVIEGRSVTLTCTSTCSLTDTSTFIWFRNTRTVNDTDNPQLILRSVRRENAGDYSCAVKRHNLTSPPRRLNVIYPPENTRVLVSHSGVIVEGDSVNLICRSESNPPAIISWFKGDTFAGSGNIYNITNIRSDHSGEYKCKAINQLGVKYSDSVTLNVLYLPKNVSASISSSGVIVEGDSVNLTCRSESNPPANISWFKENQTSSVGSGQMFSITNITPHHTQWFYCVAQNELGSQRSDAVLVAVNHRSNSHLLFGIIATCTVMFIIAINVLILFIIRKRRAAKVEDAAVNHASQQDEVYCNIKHVDGVSEADNCDDVHYESVTPQRREQITRQDPDIGDPEEIQYATIHCLKNTEKRRSQETEHHYDNFRKSKPDDALRCNMEDPTVIYSTVK